MNAARRVHNRENEYFSCACEQDEEEIDPMSIQVCPRLTHTKDRIVCRQRDIRAADNEPGSIHHALGKQGDGIIDILFNNIPICKSVS